MGHSRAREIDAGVLEPNPRLVMAVVAAGMIVGALLSPGLKSGNVAASTVAIAAHSTGK